MNSFKQITSLAAFSKGIEPRVKSQMYFTGIGNETFSIIVWYSSAFGKKKSFYYAEIYGTQNFKKNFKAETKKRLYTKMSKVLTLLGLGEEL